MTFKSRTRTGNASTISAAHFTKNGSSSSSRLGVVRQLTAGGRSQRDLSRGRSADLAIEPLAGAALPENVQSPAPTAADLFARVRAHNPARTLLAAHVGGRYADIRNPRYFDEELSPLVEW
jgi:hypothetical protein